MALQAIIEANNKKRPRVAGQDQRNKAPHELVTSQLADYEKYKKEVAEGLPVSHLLRVRALNDFQPAAMYSEEQSSTMLQFKKGQEIVVLAVFTTDWLAGYCYDKDEEDEDSAVKIFPQTLCTLVYHNLPKPKRRHEIKYWNTFGSLDDKSIADLRKSIMQQQTVFKSMQLVTHYVTLLLNCTIESYI